MAEDDPIRRIREERAARAAQRAAEAPSPEQARAAQRAARAPSAAEARAAQARAGNYVNSRDLLMDRGQAEYNRAVNRNATAMPEPPEGRLTGRGSPSMPPRPAAAAIAEAEGLGSRALRAAGSVGGAALRTAGRLAGPAGVVLGSTRAADATLTGPEGRRRLAEEQTSQGARAAMSNADMENPMPRPRVGDEINVEVAARRPRAAVRPNSRMSRREMSADELNEISQSVGRHRTGAEAEPGRYGEIARNIAGRQRDIESQAELSAMKRGGPVKKMAKGGVVKSSASSRSDGCVSKGRTKGRMV